MTGGPEAPAPIKWQHGRAALTTFLATPVIGMAQIFFAEALDSTGSPLALLYYLVVSFMTLSVLVSWLILPLLLPLAEITARRFGAAYWLAIPMGAVIGACLGAAFDPKPSVANLLILAAALTGAIMAAIYCAALRWFAKG